MTVEMSLRYRGQRCAWERVEADGAVTLVGVDDGRAFAIALDGGIGQTRAQTQLLTRWRRAGAVTGAAGSIREALALLDQAAVHAS